MPVRIGRRAGGGWPVSRRGQAVVVTDYELVIHLRDSDEPEHVALPGVPEDQAEAERQTLIYDLDQARLAEVPVFAVQTSSGFPAEPLMLDPHAVTEIDLIEAPSDNS
jgi:hypothetical protein